MDTPVKPEVRVDYVPAEHQLSTEILQREKRMSEDPGSLQQHSMTNRSNAPTRQAGQLQIFEDPCGDRPQRLYAAALLLSLLLVPLASAAVLAGLPVGAFAVSAGGNLLLAAQLLMTAFFAIMFVLSLITLMPRHAGSEAAGDLAVSVLVPAYNEEAVICKTVESLLAGRDCNLEQIIVIDDGSGDTTFETVRRAYGDHPQVRVLRQPNGGKASALNLGLAHATGDIVVVIDADTVVMPDAIGLMVRRFDAPEVGAVSGNMRVGNQSRSGLIGVQRAEYLCANNLERRGFSLLNCITVVPGAIGAYRRGLLEHIGGYHSDTLAEDCDLTIRILRQGCRVLYEPRAVAFTEAPETLDGYVKQRFRWIFGKMQAMWKHRDVMLRPRYGALGMVALPTLTFCQFVLPVFTFAIDAIIVSLGMHWLMSSLWAESLAGGASIWQALDGPIKTVVILYLLTRLSAVYAMAVEFRAAERLRPQLLPHYLLTRAVLTWVCLQAFHAALSGRRRGWNKLKRTASVPLQPHADHALGSLG